MDVFVARQPIFNLKKEIFGYELLFRTGMSNAFPDIDGDTATTSLLSSSFFTVGIDRISGGKISFVNFTEDLLLKRYPEMFPAEKIMVEILEDIEPTPDVIEACTALKENGYALALDDFVYDKRFDELIELADIIKVDFLLSPQDEIEQMLKVLSKYKCKLLAEKIETYQEFELSKIMGFEYFQGYFFSKPEVLKNKEIPANKFTILQLVSEVTKENLDIDNLERLVNQDVSISYKLLNYLNSAYFNRIQPISSLRQAIAFLGARGIRQFISLVAIGQLTEGKPNELIRTSIIRARMLELIGTELKRDGGELFMLGLFSLVDAMLDNTMENLIPQMPLSDNISEALISRTGKIFRFLRIIESYELGLWEEFDKNIADLSILPEKVVDFYLEAVGWADSWN